MRRIQEIKDVVVLTPVWREPLGMIQQFQEQMRNVAKCLRKSGVGCRHLFLDDGSSTLPDEAPCLIRHMQNKGLAHTIVDGYEAVFTTLKTPTDLVIKVDCQEHDPEMIPRIIDQFNHSEIDALYLPVVYWRDGHARKLMTDVTMSMCRLRESLTPVQQEAVCAIYNQEFPVGYQAYRVDLLQQVAPKLRNALRIFREIEGKPATWGFDLLAMMLAADIEPNRIDFIFGGWMKPWAANRSPEKIEAQRIRVRAMAAVAEKLGCSVKGVHSSQSASAN